MTSRASEPNRPDPESSGRERDGRAAARERETRSASGICELLARRPELRGILATADWLEEAVRWSA